MLKLMVGAEEAFDESTQKFVMVGGTPIDLEHSLVSVSKWEQEFEKPFLSKDTHTPEEVIAYVRAMTLTEGVSEDLYSELSQPNFEAVNAYLDRKMTATFFHDPPGQKPSREVITSELIYYWMASYGIPFSAETWNLNRLLTLIRIHNVKQAPPRKRSRSEMVAEMEALNAKRQKKYNTTG